MNFAFLALACFAKKTSQKRSCTHPRIPPSRTARESGAPFTWKSHTRDQNGKDLNGGGLNRLIEVTQRDLLRDYFKTGRLSEKLTPRTLRIYKEIAQKAIQAGNDNLHV